MPVSFVPLEKPSEPLELLRPFPGTRRGAWALPTRTALRKLRPAKIRNALRRRWFERRLNALALSPMPRLARLGTDYGGWIVPLGVIEAGWRCYSIGAGGDVSFDLDLIRRCGAAQVRSFDAVAEFVDDARREADGTAGFSAHHAALAVADGPLMMERSHDPNSRSVSSAPLFESRSFVELPGRSLNSLMSELGDEQVDLLKLDIEGAEYEVIPTLDLAAIGVKVLAMALHHCGSVGEARSLVSHLRARGFEPVACRETLRVTFVRAELL